MQETNALRPCLRPPISEIDDAARFLDAAVSAHLQGRKDLAEELLRLADTKAIGEWTESAWGKNSPCLIPPYPNCPTDAFKRATSPKSNAYC